MNAGCCSRRVWWLIAAGGLLAIGGGAIFLHGALTNPPAPLPTIPVKTLEASSEEVHQVCGACHAYPPADSFPRHLWRHEVKRGFDFLRQSRLDIAYPSSE